MMPLTMAKTGEPVTIRKITGKDEVRQPGGAERGHGQPHYDLRRRTE